MRHDASHRRYQHWSMIFYSRRKALLRPQYEEQQWKAFVCSRKICVILFNAHYPISLRSKEKELIRMFEIVIRKGEMDMSQTEWKRTGEKYSQLNAACMTVRKLWRLQWRDESKEQSVNITYLTSSDCQSSHANPFFSFLLRGGGGGGGGRRRVHPRLDPRLVYVYELYKSQYISAIRTGNQSQNVMF